MRIIKKISSLILIIGLIIPLSLISTPTNAYYNDTETSDGNVFQASSLDFEIDAGVWILEGEELEINIDTVIDRDVDLNNVGSLSFQYSAKFEYTSGSMDFCDILELEASRNSVPEYDGFLSGFTASSSGFIVDQIQENWDFSVTASALTSDLALTECHFDFVFDAWQVGMTASHGFHDTEKVSNILIADMTVTNNVSPIHDAYINENEMGANYGASTSLNVESSRSKNRRTFIKFDFTLPPTSAVYSSTLNMHLSSAPTRGRQYTAREVIGNWDQNTITWRDQPALNLAITDITEIGIASDSWVDWDVTYNVRNFVNGQPNNGWGIVDIFEDFGEDTGRAGFESSESDTEENRPYLEIIFAPPVADTDHVVINEVYYHVDPSKGADEENEWVELYNPTGSDVNISGWNLCDGNDTCIEIPAGNILPAKGFAVIAKDDTTWGYWTVHPDALKIELGDIIGNGLANSGDTVYLLDVSDTEVDAVSYETDTYKLNPAVPKSNRGNSIARVVKGYDTDFALDWIKNTTPNPGTNPSDSGLEIFKITSEGIEVNDGAVWLDSSEVSITTQEPGAVEEDAEEFIEEDKKEEPQILEEIEDGDDIDGEEPVEDPIESNDVESENEEFFEGDTTEIFTVTPLDVTSSTSYEPMNSPTPTPEPTPESTPTPMPDPIPTPEPVVEPTPEPTPSPTPTPEPTPTLESTLELTVTPIPTLMKDFNFSGEVETVNEDIEEII